MARDVGVCPFVLHMAHEIGRGELPPGTQVGEYRIQGTVAIGGMGTVYAALHPIIGKRAAVKVIAPEMSRDREAVQRFLLEARAVNQIGDPNIVDIFGFGTLPDGRVYLVMEWLIGETLGTRTRTESLLLPEVVHVVRTAARTLETVHSCGFIHRDLKPDNVFLAARRNVTNVHWPYDVKLLDFGIAKLVTRDDPWNSLTRAGIIVGTPRYVSPEQARGLPVDAATDVYSLGVVTYELLVGVPPFVQRDPFEVMAQHIHEPPVPPRSHRPDIPPVLDDLVVQMLAKDPRARPRLSECRRRLDAALDPVTTVGVGRALAAPRVDPIVTPMPAPAPVFTPPPGELAAPRGALGLVMAVGAIVVLAAVLLGAALLREPRGARRAIGIPLPTSQPAADAGPAPLAPEEDRR
ncbi:MAG TPA: protein kinase [Kofleriaceae bacterium]|nr:protein kinase [Kofleriaceae bacterium]